jgi:predicted Zn-dependent peptidase
MTRWLGKLVLLMLWALPLKAQERIETSAGLVERRLLVSGASVILQPLAHRPVVAMTLVFPWGRAHDPERCDYLNRVLARSSAQYPGGSLLLRLEEMGGLSSYRTGQHWSSWTLVVPQGYALWALQIQLDRLRGQWFLQEDVAGLLATLGAPNSIDSTSLRSLFLQQWNPAQAVLAVSGGFDEREVKIALNKLGPTRAGQAPPAGTQLTYRPGRLAWNLARPNAPRQRAAAYLWQSALEGSSVELDLDPAEQGYWLSTPVTGSAVPGDPALDEARSQLAASLPGAGFQLTARTRHRAVQRWLEEWDDLATRSRLLALEQARGELGRSLQTYEALSGYELANWRQDLSPLEALAARTEITAAAGPPQPGRPTSGSLKAKAGSAPARAAVAPAPPFARLEYAPNCGALIQTVADLPVVAVRAIVPGGTAADSAALAGRAEWLAAYWQLSLDADFPTQVEAQTYGWQFSAYLPRDQVTPWLTRFFRLWNQPTLDPLLAQRAQPPVPRPNNPLQEGYQSWLRLLFPADHPLGRQGMQTPLRHEQIQELHSQVRQRARWNLFLSGDVTPAEVEVSLTQAAPPQPDPSLASSFDSLPTQPQLPSEPVVFPADVKRCSLLIGGYGPSRREPDYYAFVLLLQALAADPLRSRLQLELRLKRPLADRVDINFLSSTGVSPWLLRIDCSKDNLAQVQSAVAQQLEQLRQKEVTSAELDLAVARLEGQQQVANLNSTGRVQQLRNLELFRLSDSYNQGFAGIYRNISRKDLLASARVRLQPQRLATLVVTPKT